MSITALDFASPFFPVSYVQGEEEYALREKSIVFNISDEDLYINARPLGFFRSTVALNTVIKHVERALIIEKFDAYPDEKALFEQVKNKPYFADTVFVIVGDHGARVYGKEKIPMWTYELPLIFYSPKYFAATEVDQLISQIDIMPTLLGLLHISYDTVAFGHDVLKGDPAHNYVLLSHNRDVALYRGEELDELGLQKSSQTLHYKKGSREQTRLVKNDESLKNAASIFQTAYNMLMNHNYKVGVRGDI